jgi:uncharacterized protein
MLVRFEWDPSKADSNYRKHRVLFETAALAFEDPGFLMEPDLDGDDEERWRTIGLVEGVLLLLVVHTLRDENDEEIVRIISAREVTAHERRRYEGSEQ